MKYSASSVWENKDEYDGVVVVVPRLFPTFFSQNYLQVNTYFCYDF